MNESKENRESESTGKLNEILACVSVAIFNIPAGLVIGFSAILIPQLEADDSEIKVDRSDISWIASVCALMWPMSGIFVGFLVDMIGRIHTIRLTIFPYIVGWILIAMARNLTMIMAGRVLTAISLSFAGNPSILYITEVARTDYRGSLTSIVPAFVSFGTVIVYTMGYFYHWRTVSWVCMILCLPCLIAITLWSPESSMWLVSKGRKQDALKSLKHLLRNNRAGLAEERIAELVKEQNIKGTKGSAGVKMLRAIIKPNTFKPAIILSMLFVFEHFSGIYITMFYTVNFFQTVGTNMDPYISSIVTGLLRFVMGFVTSCLLTKFGRRHLLFFSCSGMAIFMAISGYYTREISFGRMEKNLVPVICILLYIVVSVIGLMTIPWTMTAEFFSSEIRGLAQSWMTTIATIIMFASLKVYPFLDGILGGSYAVQWFFAGVCIVANIFIFIFIPEIRGKELTEIQDYFDHNTIYILSKDKPRTKIVKNFNREEEAVALKGGV